MSTVATRPSGIPGLEWRYSQFTSVWALPTSVGTYTIKFSGFDFVIRLDGERQITRRGGLTDAMTAAEQDAIQRITTAKTAHQAAVEPRTHSHADVCSALTAALDLAVTALPDPAVDSQQAVRIAVVAIGELLDINATDYNPYLDKEP